MSSYDKSFPVSWEEIHRNSNALAWRLHDISSFKGIIAVTRGGLVPAAIVARELDMRLIDTVCVSSYKEKSRSDVEFLKNKTMAGDGDNWLIVDDLVDTGETIKALRPILPKAHYATVYAKPEGLKFVDTYVHQVPQNHWVFFERPENNDS